MSATTERHPADAYRSAASLPDEVLVDTLVQIHARCCAYPESRVLHDRAFACKAEIANRLAALRARVEVLQGVGMELYEAVVTECQRLPMTGVSDALDEYEDEPSRMGWRLRAALRKCRQDLAALTAAPASEGEE